MNFAFGLTDFLTVSRKAVAQNSTYGAQPRWCVGMTEDQRAPEVVHRGDQPAGGSRKDQIVHRAGIVSVHRMQIARSTFAALSAQCAASMGASGMYASGARALPKPRIRIQMPGSVESAAARSGSATITAALPSAGCVWVPNVTVPRSSTGLRPARPSLVENCTPHCQSPSRDPHESARPAQERQQDVPLVEGMIVCASPFVLFLAQQDQVVLFLPVDSMFGRHVFGGLHHCMRAERIAGHVREDEILRLASPARFERIRIVNVRTFEVRSQAIVNAQLASPDSISRTAVESARTLAPRAAGMRVGVGEELTSVTSLRRESRMKSPDSAVIDSGTVMIGLGALVAVTVTSSSTASSASATDVATAAARAAATASATKVPLGRLAPRRTHDSLLIEPAPKKQFFVTRPQKRIG